MFCKNVFLKVWKKSQEIPVPKQVPVPKYLFFNKVASGLQFFQKEILAPMFSSEFCETFKTIFFDKTPLVVASVFL